MKLDHEVSLNESQKTEIYALLLERSAKFSQAQQKSNNKKLSKSDFKQANEQALTKLQLILTSEQFEKLKVLRQESQRQKAIYKEDEVYKSLQDIELDF